MQSAHFSVPYGGETFPVLLKDWGGSNICGCLSAPPWQIADPTPSWNARSCHAIELAHSWQGEVWDKPLLREGETQRLSKFQGNGAREWGQKMGGGCKMKGGGGKKIYQRTRPPRELLKILLMRSAFGA